MRIELFGINVAKIPGQAAVTARMVRDVRRAMVAETNQTVRLMKMPTTTWLRKPAIWATVVADGDSLIGHFNTDSEVYIYLDEGTDIRHAVMRDGTKFRPKTHPGSLGASGGSGHGNVFVSNEILLEGIDAREFSTRAIDFRYPYFERRMDEVMTKYIEYLLPE